ncbi:BMP family ABC transporter substrate-binding protein [bacterium]|nr:MAG: BMP family ABC transporter substrate-binding protein [bacterium]
MEWKGGTMRRSIHYLLVLCLLLLGASIQPGKTAAAAACPAEGCSIFLPLVMKPRPVLHLGLVTTAGGSVDDNGYNDMAWQAVQDAETNLGSIGAYIESASTQDYTANINTFISQGSDLIITIGWDMADATQAAALAHPGQKFTIADYLYTPQLSNVLSQVYASEQTAFLCGYIAAGMTHSGVVATLGGMNISTVTQFMHGYSQGVTYYNQHKGATVQVLGTNSFAGSFNNFSAGYNLALGFINQGADVIFPVAGSTGMGAAQAVEENAGTWLIGVDTDWKIQYPLYANVVLTSAMKNVRASTYAVIKKVYQGTFSGGTYLGTLANEGVSVGSYATAVPQALRNEVDQVKALIMNGSIVVTP